MASSKRMLWTAALMAALVLGAAAIAAAAGRSVAAGIPPGCAAVLADRSAPAIRAFDPRPQAPRVFAIQYKQSAASVASYASFRRTIDCVLRRYVLPYRARGRPNVVVLTEDIGLTTLGTGARGAAARYLFSHPSSGSCLNKAGLCATLALLSSLDSAYRLPLAAYKARFPSLAGLGQSFVAGTDTIVRSFMGTFSALAKRYRLYLIGSGDLPPFGQSRASADLAAFSDPGLKPRPATVYVATAPQVHNEVFMWGPRDVRPGGPDVMRNVVASNLKVPLTQIELALGFAPGPAHGPAAIANLRPYQLPGTRARIGFATSLPAFVYGSPPPGLDPCSDTSSYYMRCLDRLGANLVIQDEANPGPWTGPDGNGIEQWQPLSWMSSTYRTVSDPSVRFAYNVTAMMVGNLADLVFDGQSAITQRGGTRGPGCRYIGNSRFVPGEDQPSLRDYAGVKHGFVALAPWVAPDGPRARLRRVGSALAPASGSRLQNDYLETALIADLPFPVDRQRLGCA